MSTDKNKRIKAARGGTLFTKKDDRQKTEKRERKKIDRDKYEAIAFINRYTDDHNVAKIVSYLKTEGLDVSAYKDSYINRRIRGRVTRLQLKSYLEYYTYLKENPKETAILKESLSINVTRFYRNYDTYQYVKTYIIPAIAKSGTGVANFWSAGCAVGCEPYSMAMISSLVKNRKISILGTDIKQELINMARLANYDKAYLGELTDHEIRSFFDQLDSETFKVKIDIRSMVNFKTLDLTSDTYPENLDLIFCRNVLIYIDKEKQKKILKRMIKSLSPGGYIVLGRTESIFNRDIGDIELVDSKHRVYRKLLPGEIAKKKTRR